MALPASELSALIRRRRSVFPKSYLPEKPVDRALLEQLLENANWAPTHKLTEPWRFQVFHSAESRARLGDYLSGFYQRNTPPEAFSEEKMQKQGDNPRRAGAVIAILLHRDPAESIPEFEEIAAVAMAVQNMWLTCAALGLGCYWSTPRAALQAGEFLGLAPNERCLGLFYLGWHEMPEIAGKRGDVGEKVVWR
ncbi:MAG: nitroreductase [Saprospirales bacterium]|nr:nitroreductase [Saprospirales bacterium]MBK8921772.1 nitroreductase [Saprospirales bacterium]